MGKDLYCRLGPIHHTRLAEFGADVVLASDCGITSKCLLGKVGFDAGEVLRKDCCIQVHLKSWDIENSLTCRNGNRNGDVDTLLACYGA